MAILTAFVILSKFVGRYMPGIPIFCAKPALAARGFRFYLSQVPDGLLA